MLDEFGAEIEHADSRLDATMKKMAKVLHLSDGKESSQNKSLTFVKPPLTKGSLKKNREKFENKFCNSMTPLYSLRKIYL